MHAGLGGRILRAEPESLRISGTVAQWQAWVEMAFLNRRRLRSRGGLALLQVDREADTGLYYEPNVWVAHDAQPVGGPGETARDPLLVA